MASLKAYEASKGEFFNTESEEMGRILDLETGKVWVSENTYGNIVDINNRLGGGE